MKAAVAKLAKVARAPENQRRLAELSFAFADITPLPVKGRHRRSKMRRRATRPVSDDG